MRKISLDLDGQTNLRMKLTLANQKENDRFSVERPVLDHLTLKEAARTLVPQT